MSCARTTPVRALVVALASLVVMPAAAIAHERSISYSSWQIDGRRARVVVRLPHLKLSVLPWQPEQLERLLPRYLGQRLRLSAGEAPCSAETEPRALQSVPGNAVYEWDLTCPPTGALQIRSDVLTDVVPSHLHFARLEENGEPARERLLTSAEPSWTWGSGSSTAEGAPGPSLPTYLLLGIEHILSGYDHLVFVFALLLIGGSIGEVAKVVTGFTVAHSITLGLATLGYVRPEPAAIEALIGMSIALVAVENVWTSGRRGSVLPVVVTVALGLLALAAARGTGAVSSLTLGGLALFSFCYFRLLDRMRGGLSLRWAIAFLFGLVHGFGFAGVLMEAELPAQRLAAALFGFNLGVELGQLAAVSLLWPLLWLAGRYAGGRFRPLVVEAGSAAVLAVGLFWFITRAYG